MIFAANLTISLNRYAFSYDHFILALTKSSSGQSAYIVTKYLCHHNDTLHWRPVSAMASQISENLTVYSGGQQQEHQFLTLYDENLPFPSGLAPQKEQQWKDIYMPWRHLAKCGYHAVTDE